MAAKIKSHPKLETKHIHGAKPKGVSDKAFHQVYWPFMPVLIAVCLLLNMVAQSVPLHHLTGHVLGFQTSKSAEVLLSNTNIQRQKNGEKVLKLNDELMAAAQAKANDMAKQDYWSHVTPQGIQPWTFITSAGYVYERAGENLATGFSDDAAVVNAWMASPEHRANILDSNYSEVGFGYANIDNYKAIGGGPMTIVVAMYGEPAAGANASPIQIPTYPTTVQTLGSSTRATTVWRGPLAGWTSTLLLAAAFAAGFVFIEKHRRYLKSAIASGERYILRHPLTDLGLLLIVGLVYLLVQTAGYIQ